MLAYVPRIRPSFRLVQVDRTGRARALTPMDASLFWEPRVSPDGRSIAAIKVGPNNQLWRLDLEREALTRLAHEWDNSLPVWTPDGRFVIFASGPRWTLHRVPADGSGAPEPLGSGPGSRQSPGSITADGRLLAYAEWGAATGQDIFVMPLEPRGEPTPFLQSPADESWPAIAPSGRLVAYQSDESGETEVYLRSFPDGGGRVQVSSGGGFAPVWPRSGRELFYRASSEAPKGRVMAVDVEPGPPLRVSRPRLLFEHRYDEFEYDVFPDGRHFVMTESDPDALQVKHFQVVQNWFEELKRLAPSR